MASSGKFTDGRQKTQGLCCRPGSFVEFGSGEPQLHEADGTPSWIGRGANFAVVLSAAIRGSTVVQHEIPDESMLVLSPAVRVTIHTGGTAIDVDEEALVILPPGSARIVARSAGTITRIFSSAVAIFCEAASNADAYHDVQDVAPLTYWPDPAGGFRPRVYLLRDHSEDVGFGRLFRSTNLMVNIFPPSDGPRDLHHLSPHDHADFEQGSLSLAGDFTHYLRTPWVADRTQWRDDQQIDCSGETLMVIPPRMIHTTSWSTIGARLIDIFSPPRADFSLKERWVRNAADYPLPDHLGEI